MISWLPENLEQDKLLQFRAVTKTFSNFFVDASVLVTSEQTIKVTIMSRMMALNFKKKLINTDDIILKLLGNSLTKVTIFVVLT